MHAKRGFSLVELLAVIAIIAILTALIVSFSWNTSRQFELSATGIQNLLSQAQTEAIARNTYVWVGFSNSTNSVSGLPQLTAAAAYSPDGTVSATPLALTKVNLWPNVLLTDSGSVSTPVQALLPPVAGTILPSLTKTTYTPKTFPAMGQPAAFVPKYTVTFTPQGEALFDPAPIAQEGYQPAIDLGLRRTVGAGPIAANTDDIVLRIYGGSGKIRQFRLQ